MSQQQNSNISNKIKMNQMNKQASLSKFKIFKNWLKLLKNDYQITYLHLNIISKVYD